MFLERFIGYAKYKKDDIVVKMIELLLDSTQIEKKIPPINYSKLQTDKNLQKEV